MPVFTSTRLLLAVAFGASIEAQYLRESAQRLRHFDNRDPSTFQYWGENAQAQQLFADMVNNPDTPVEEAVEEIEEKQAAEQEAFQALLETMAKIGARSMPPTEAPTVSVMPSDVPSQVPTTSVMPSDVPSTVPTPAPNVTGRPTAAPTITASASPSLSTAPSALPTLRPTPPTAVDPQELTDFPTFGPTSAPTSSPTVSPTSAPSTAAPTVVPTLAECGISAQERAQRIMTVLQGAVVDSSILVDLTTPQGLATEWILNQDAAVACPDDPKFLQRWVLAVIYYSTNGDQWVQCSDNPAATDDCGNLLPFLGATRFLSAGTECDWAGISCINGCVSEIEFEENNLVGTIPTEIGLLSDLAVWGMERGGLTSTIPTEVGMLKKLIFLDLDFNALTGSLPTELFTLTDLTQLGTFLDCRFLHSLDY